MAHIFDNARSVKLNVHQVCTTILILVTYTLFSYNKLLSKPKFSSNLFIQLFSYFSYKFPKIRKNPELSIALKILIKNLKVNDAHKLFYFNQKKSKKNFVP